MHFSFVLAFGAAIATCISALPAPSNARGVSPTVVSRAQPASLPQIITTATDNLQAPLGTVCQYSPPYLSFCPSAHALCTAKLTQASSSDAVSSAIGDVENILEGLLENVSNLVNQVLDDLLEGVDDIVDTASDQVPGLIDTLLSVNCSA